MEITPPEKFSFDSSKWIAWKQKFERFRTASDLTSVIRTLYVLANGIKSIANG